MLMSMLTSSMGARYVEGLGRGGWVILTFMLPSTIRARYVAGLGMEDGASWAALLVLIVLDPYINIHVNIYIYMYLMHMKNRCCIRRAFQTK